MAKVSICIPCYNNKEEVKRLLDSIVLQDYKDYEVIISDDSTNNEIEEMISKEFGTIVDYHHNKKQLGHIYNWNEALKYATGEYVKIMFSDDWFTYPDSLRKFVQLLEEQPDADFVFSGNFQVSSQSSYARAATPEYVEELKKDYRYLFISNLVGAPSNTMYRRSTGARFDEKSNWASDVFLYFEVLKNQRKFVCTTEPLISIGIHENQYTESFQKRDDRIYQDYKYMYQKYNLQKNKMCREHFVKMYLLPYHKGLQEWKNCGYITTEYIRRVIPYFWKDTICSYTRAAFRKIRKLFVA